MTEQPPEREPSWLERLTEARRRMDAKQAEMRARQACHAEVERRRVCAWQVSGPLWEAELQAHFRSPAACAPYTLPFRPPPRRTRPDDQYTLRPRPPQTRPYDQETDR